MLVSHARVQKPNGQQSIECIKRADLADCVCVCVSTFGRRKALIPLWPLSDSLMLRVLLCILRFAASVRQDDVVCILISTCLCRSFIMARVGGCSSMPETPCAHSGAPVGYELIFVESLDLQHHRCIIPLLETRCLPSKTSSDDSQGLGEQECHAYRSALPGVLGDPHQPRLPSYPSSSAWLVRPCMRPRKADIDQHTKMQVGSPCA
jgi:hypothetical protein